MQGSENEQIFNAEMINMSYRYFQSKKYFRSIASEQSDLLQLSLI